jgi:nucleotide-binding universal stress UspA family protein
MVPLHRILVPTDFSPHAQYAFDVALGLARANHAELLLLHVATPPGPEQVSFGEVQTRVEPDNYYRNLLAQMRQLVGQSPRAVTLQYLITEGEPVKEIDRVARERHCDLIVVGTYAHSRVERLLMGSTAEHLVRTAPCPVLTVKVPPPAEAELAKVAEAGLDSHTA